MASEPAQQLSTGVTAELYRAAIGPRGQDYYLRHFTRFDANGKSGATWHWPAYWGTLNWLVYRKMWGWALAYIAALLGLALVVFGVGKLLLDYSDTTGVLLFLLFLTGAFVLPGLYANAWYYSHCSEKISMALRNTAEVKDACEVLAAQASSNRRWFGLAAVNVAMLALTAGLVTFMLNPVQESERLAQGGVVKLAERELPSPVRPVAVAVSQAEPAATAAPSPVAEPSVPPATPPAVLPPVDMPRLTSAAKIEELLAKLAEPAADKTDGTPADNMAEKVGEKAGEKTGDKALAKVADKAVTPGEKTRPAVPEPVQVATLSTDKPAPSKSPVAQTEFKTSTQAQPQADTPARPVVMAQAKPARPDAAAPVPVAAKAAAPKPKRLWFVQAGAFAQESNAQNVRSRIEAAGLQTSADPSDTQAGRLIRVRVGPFDTKAEAEKAALQIKALDLPAVLFRE